MADHQQKYEARKAVSDAIKAGALDRPDRCEDCGNRGDIEAHHTDYSRPLDVEFLCTACHGDRHSGLEKSLAKRVYGMRIAQGLSQRELAERADMDHTYISHLEAGRRDNPTYSTLRRLADALDTSPDQLMGWSHNPT